MQASGRAARVLSYILADNEHCKQVLLAQETPQDLNGTQSQAGSLLFIVNRICAMGSHVADVSNGRVRDQKSWHLA